MHKEKEEELSRELFRLEQVLKKALFGSREFKNLKKKITDMGLEMNVLLMVTARDIYEKNASVKRKKISIRLSVQDKEFLKTNGIKW